tara:strand:+ start:273 stop:488 length:216 start_codon:yes stop_codon:yes gene_type:complete
VLHVGVPGFCNWIVVSIDDFVQILCHPLSDLVETFVVELLGLWVSESGERNGGKIADSDLVLTRVLDDLCA